MTIIWPLSAHKVTSDALLDCFGAVMKMSIEDDREANENVEKIGKMIIASFRNAFGNSSNKKKVCSFDVFPLVININIVTDASNIHANTPGQLARMYPALVRISNLVSRFTV